MTGPTSGSTAPPTLTESESRIIAGLVHQLRDVRPPNGHKLLPALNAILAAIVLGVGGIGWSYIGDINKNTNKAAALEDRIERNEKYAQSDKASLDAWRNGVDLDRQRLKLVDDQATRNAADLKNFGDKLEAGRQVRERDIKSLEDGYNKVAIELNGLKIQVGYMNRQGGEGRNPAQPPFGQNQMWMVPPPSPELLTPQVRNAAYRQAYRPEVRSTPPRRRLVRRRAQPFLVALFGKSSNIRWSAFRTPMGRARP